MKVAVVYFSQTGVTAKLAGAVMEGLGSHDNIHVTEHRINGTEIFEGRFRNQPLLDELNGCDGIIFGSPTYMGSVAAQFKAFADATSDQWCEQLWAGKLAAGFTCGSGLNGDQAATLQYMATLANQQGMLWMGLDLPKNDPGKLTGWAVRQGPLLTQRTGKQTPVIWIPPAISASGLQSRCPG
ncbi:flavodoxin family protein [Aliamphritea spongicola]|nr:flavodoxin family protein [Aliamphritea spongicola]